MSWYGDGTFKQDLLEEIETVLERHFVAPHEAVGDILDVVGYVLGRMDYKADIYKKAKADALYEMEAKIRASLKD